MIALCFADIQLFPVSRAQPGSACQGAFHESPQPGLIERHLLEPAIVGLGRGTAYNIYDYQGYGIDHTEAQARFEEAETIMLAPI